MIDQAIMAASVKREEASLNAGRGRAPRNPRASHASRPTGELAIAVTARRDVR